jgi:hypothetical protein
MKNFINRWQRSLVTVITTSLIIASGVYAGPPLICHTIQIGNAKSLPWVNEGWNLSGGETYNLRNLVPDTLGILNPSTPVLVRMETLRRATLYAKKDPVIAKELLLKLHARATDAEAGGHPDGLAWFDAGYLAETYKQWMDTSANPATGIDGYGLVKKAIELRGNDPQMEFAAALVTFSGPEKEHREHVQRATAGAKKDPLLARNLASRFMGPQSQSIAEMFAKTGKAN